MDILQDNIFVLVGVFVSYWWTGFEMVAFHRALQPRLARSCRAVCARMLRVGNIQIRNIATRTLMAVVLLFPGLSYAQECDYLKGSDPWGHPERPMAYILTDDEVIWLYPAFEDYMFMLQDIEEAIGIGAGNNAYPLNGEVGYNAWTVICGDWPRIVYDRRLSSSLGYSGAIAVLAHELGHIECGHLYKEGLSGDPHEQELEADRFAGSAMRNLGYSLEEALRYTKLLSDQPSRSHPPRSQRESALRSGWNEPSFAAECSQRTDELYGW